MRTLRAGVLALCLLYSRPAWAMFGEEAWLSGQNQIMIAMFLQDLEQTANLVGLLANLKMLLSTTNEALATARTAYRQVQIVRSYGLDDLRRDAQAGLYDAYPDLEIIDEETRALVDNGRAVRDGRFWTHLDQHDPVVSQRLHATFDYAYQSTIWPIAFPEAMRFRPQPSPVDALIQERFRRTEQAHQVAMQQMSFSVFARQVEQLTADADEQGHLPSRIQAQSALMGYQTMRNTTESLELSKIDAAEAEQTRGRDRDDRAQMADELRETAPMLFRPRPLQPFPKTGGQ